METLLLHSWITNTPILIAGALTAITLAAALTKQITEEIEENQEEETTEET